MVNICPRCGKTKSVFADPSNCQCKVESGRFHLLTKEGNCDVCGKPYHYDAINDPLARNVCLCRQNTESTSLSSAPIPSSVAVGPYPYQVIADQGTFDRAILKDGWDDSTSGMHSESDLTIYVRCDGPRAIQRETLFHEVRHAVDATVGIKGTDEMTAEQFITRTTPILLDTLRRNPALVAFLLEA